MTFRVELTARAARDLGFIYRSINAEDSSQARAWFNGLEKAVSSLEELPARGAVTPEDEGLRHLLYGKKPDVYRVIYAVDQPSRVVTVVHIRHRARDAFVPKSGG